MVASVLPKPTRPQLRAPRGRNRVSPKPSNARPVPNAVLGVLIFVLTEVMLFAGLVSAYSIVESQVDPGLWPPPGQPRLPVALTAVNSIVLLLSGVALFFAGRRFADRRGGAKALFATALGLGALFVIVQGSEWVALIAQGLVLTSSPHASFFYLIVGTHALHAIGAIIALGWLFSRMMRNRLPADTFWAGRLFWYFVVGVWPILYVQVYL